MCLLTIYSLLDSALYMPFPKKFIGTANRAFLNKDQNSHIAIICMIAIGFHDGENNFYDGLPLRTFTGLDYRV